jgi:hypothetical protein
LNRHTGGSTIMRSTVQCFVAVVMFDLAVSGRKE